MTHFCTELERFLPDLHKFARVLTDSEEDAKDLVQDCVERSLRRQYHYTKGTNMKSWLFTMMKNLFISKKRKESVAVNYVQRVRNESNNVQRASQTNYVFLKETLSAISNLPRIERDAVIAFGLEDMSHLETASRTGTPVGTLKSRLSRGRENLRNVLGMERGAMAHS